MATTKHTKHKASRNKRRRAASATPKDYWRHRARPLRFGDERFRATLINPGKGGHGTDSYITTDQVQDFSWDDTSSQLSGSLTFQALPIHVPISQQSQIRMEYAPTRGAKFERIFTMKVGAPDRNMVNKQWTLDLQTSLTQAANSQDDYRFKTDKRHPRGWTADEIARFVCHKLGIPVGRLAKCTHRITNLVKKDAAGMDMIVLAYRAERRATGRRFFMSWDGRMNVDPLARSEYLLEVAGAIIDASYKSEFGTAFATSMTVRGTTRKQGSKHKRRKFHVTVTSKVGVQKFGYVHRTVTDDNAHTEDAARKYARQQLAKLAKPTQTLSLTLPLMPTVRRGDAFKVNWPREGLTQIVFVSGASHSVAPGSMTTQLTATFSDPFKDQASDIAAAKRRAKARERKRAEQKRTAPKGGTSKRSSRRRGAHA